MNAAAFAVTNTAGYTIAIKGTATGGIGGVFQGGTGYNATGHGLTATGGGVYSGNAGNGGVFTGGGGPVGVGNHAGDGIVATGGSANNHAGTGGTFIGGDTLWPGGDPGHGIYARGGNGADWSGGSYAGLFDGRVYVNGVVYATAFSQISDERYKTDITPVTDALDKVSHLRGYTYGWDRAAHPDKNFPTGRQIGFVAQQVETVVPEMVTTDAKGEKTVAYQSAIPLLIEAVKELRAQNEALRAEVAALHKK